LSTAIFGGTFDPVHTGHVKMVCSVLEQFEPERIIIVPNANPPHKKNEVSTDYTHRLNMLCLAFEDIDRVEISDYESENDRYYYSIDTMRYFRNLYGEDTRMIIGGDSLKQIHHWYKYEDFLKENKFIVFCRDYTDETEKVIEYYRTEGVDILVSDMPFTDVSSTEIRKQLSEGDLRKGFLPEKVIGYIRANSLYGGK